MRMNMVQAFWDFKHRIGEICKMLLIEYTIYSRYALTLVPDFSLVS